MCGYTWWAKCLSQYCKGSLRQPLVVGTAVRTGEVELQKLDVQFGLLKSDNGFQDDWAELFQVWIGYREINGAPEVLYLRYDIPFRN